MTSQGNELRELSSEELESVSGAINFTFGPIRVFAGGGRAGIGITGLGTAWVNTDGSVCGSPTGAGGAFGCTPPIT